VEAFQNAALTLGTLQQGQHIFALTRGQFSMIDAILHVLSQLGEAHISVWTWTVAEYEVQCLNRLRSDERILSGLLVIDHGARAKNEHIIRQWQSVYGETSVRFVLNHAKIATVYNDTYKVLLRGSCNLNKNMRFENLDLTEGGEDFDLIKRVESGLEILPANFCGADAFANTGLRTKAKGLTFFEAGASWTL
jgi:hypothetical protein